MKTQLIIIFLALSGIVQSQELFTIGQVFDYEVGDEFHRNAYGEYNGIAIPPNAARFEIIGKYFSDELDTVHYIRYNRNYNSEFFEQPEPHLVYTFDDFVDTISFTNLDSSISFYDDGFTHPGAEIFSDSLCNIPTVGYSYENPSKSEIFMSQYGQGLGKVWYRHYEFDMQSNYNDYVLFYYKKGDIICGNPDNTTESIENPDEAFSAFKLFPIPARDKLNIETFYNEPLKIQLFTINGQRVLEKTIQNSTESIELDMCGQGIFLVKVFVQGQVYCRKIIVY